MITEFNVVVLVVNIVLCVMNIYLVLLWNGWRRETENSLNVWRKESDALNESLMNGVMRGIQKGVDK